MLSCIIRARSPRFQVLVSLATVSCLEAAHSGASQSMSLNKKWTWALLNRSSPHFTPEKSP